MRPTFALGILLVLGTSTLARADVDWRSKGATVPVQDEGATGCSLSWALAAAEAVAGNVQIVHGSLLSLSSQELVDCAADCGGSGTPQCTSGGCPQLGCVFTFIGSHGLCSQASYPFTGRPGACQSTCTPSANTHVPNWLRITPGDETALITALNQGPVLARLEIGDHGSPLPAYLAYNSAATFSPPAYDASVVQWVLLVGYTSSVYIVQNSLGSGWGDSGYLNLARGSNALGVANVAYLPSAVALSGACLSANGSCVEVDQTTCQAANGTFQGTGTFCPTACPAGAAIASVPVLSRGASAVLATLLCLAGLALLLRFRQSRT